MKLLFLTYLLTYFTVYGGTQSNKGSFDNLSKSKVKRVATLDKALRCPEGWNLSFRTCFKSFAPPVAGMTYKMVKDECKKLGAAPAAMRNAAEEIGVQKSLKLFRNNTKINDLIILGVQQGQLGTYTISTPHPNGPMTHEFYTRHPFWVGSWDIEDQYFCSRYNKFIPHKTPASTLAKRKAKIGFNNPDDSTELRCLTYDSESMLMDEINCDCSKNKCINPHKITAVTCSKYAEFNNASFIHYNNETFKLQSIPDYTKKYKCDSDWTLVVNKDVNYNNSDIEAMCIKAFRPPFSYVSYHSSEQLCGEYDARPSAPSFDAEAKTALSLLDSLYGYPYNASVYVGVRLLENFIAFEERHSKDDKNLKNGMNQYINDWDYRMFNPNIINKETIYIPLGPSGTVGMFQKSRCMQYPCPDIPEMQHYCVIWEVKYGYRAAPCDPVGYTKPINAVLCSKPPIWKFIPTFCANKTQNT